jgi:peptidoglycan/xylan/chitin deacetylase (PgdA/CDA1 family)
MQRMREKLRSQAPLGRLVLCYHAVTDSWPDPLAVSPAAFERQVRSLLRRGYRPVRAEEALVARSRVLHLTFDDAYRNLDSVLPVLERLHVPATIFACTEFAADGRPLTVPELAVRGAGYDEETATMDWDALRALAERGFDVGSHTASHAHLTRLSDRELDYELRSSRERIETELARPCRFIAYPYGENDERVRKSAQAAGYMAGYSLRSAGDPLDRYGLPRVAVYRGDGMLRFTIKTSPLRSATTSVRDLFEGRAAVHSASAQPRSADSSTGC